MKIAVVEDEPQLARALKRGLGAEGYEVEVFHDAATAKERIEFSGNLYDLILLDPMLPDEDGAIVCSDLRATGVNAPILLLTARDSTEDKIDLLDRGADDFLSKPFEFGELLARSRALIRRADTGQQPEIVVDDVRIVPDQRAVFHGAERIPLTAREFELLLYMARHRGRAISREELVTKVWKQKEMPPTNVVDVYMWNLRKKLDDPYDTKIIQTIHGVGYSVKG